MKPRFIGLLLLGLAAGACSEITGPEAERALLMTDDSSVADFSAWLVRPGSDPAPDLRVEGGLRQVSIQGALGTPYPCFDVQGYVEQDGAELHFTISATRKPVMCIAVVATFAYQGTFRDLPPGLYQVRVTHSVGDHSTEVLETSVSVR